MLTSADFFPNRQIHAWTHGGVYYTISEDGRILGSYNKFKYTSFYIGQLPERPRWTRIHNEGGVHEQEFETGSSSEYNSTILSILVQGSTIFLEIDFRESESSDPERRIYVSRSYGASWKRLEVEDIHFGFADPREETIWRGGTFAFMTIDSRNCYAYFWAPQVKKMPDGTFKLMSWYVVRDDGQVICDPANNTLNTVVLEERFTSNGNAKEAYDHRLNNMDTHLEEDRKAYTLRWPAMTESAEVPQTIDRLGFVVNPFDVVNYQHDGKTYAIVRVLQTLTVRTGLIANQENIYKPDYLSTRVPVFYVINVDNPERGTSFEKCPVRVLDLVGFDRYFKPLHTAQYTQELGVYSFMGGLLGKDFDFQATYGQAGTIYDYAPNSEELFPERPNFFKFTELATGDLLKITDPTNSKDMVAFLSRHRVKVCVDDPTKEHNWVDKSTSSSYVRPTQKVRAAESIVILSEDTQNKVSPTFNSWCAFDTVLRYDYEDNKILGYPVYDNSTNNTDRRANLVGYNFPSIIKTNGSYTIGTVLKSDSSPLRVDTNESQYSDWLDDKKTNLDTQLYYGGFVGAERGYIGSLAQYVVGITVPPEPEFPPEAVDPEPELPDPPQAAPSTIAIIDDIKKSASASVAPNRRSVTFGTAAGSAIANLGVNSDRWYIEVTNIASDKVFFGVASGGFDVDKEPGEDTNVLAIGMDGSVRRGGKLIFKTPAPLYNPSAPNNIIGIRLDMVRRVIEFTNGAGILYSVAASGMPKGIVYFYMGASPTQTGENSISLNFGQVPFEYPVPNGYISGYGIK